MSAAKLRIGLVDDHAVVRAGYRRLLELEPDLHIVTEHADAESAIATLGGAGTCPIDVLVLDLSMPGRSGFDLLRRLGLRWPALRLLVFTMHDSPAMVAQCLRLGAAGFVTKSSEPQVLIDALRLVARGEVVLSPDVAAKVDLGHDRAGRAPPHLRLNAREFDVLHRLLAGRSIDEIARALQLSPKTVANLQTELRAKLGVSSTVELMQYARVHGLGPL